jgi:hypothetical protein
LLVLKNILSPIRGRRLPPAAGLVGCAAAGVKWCKILGRRCHPDCFCKLKSAAAQPIALDCTGGPFQKDRFFAAISPLGPFGKHFFP